MRSNNRGLFTFNFSFDEVELGAGGGQYEEDGGECLELHVQLTSPAGLLLSYLLSLSFVRFAKFWFQTNVLNSLQNRVYPDGCRSEVGHISVQYFKEMFGKHLESPVQGQC